MSGIEPPPLIQSLTPSDNLNINQWLRKIWVLVGGRSGAIAWDNVDKTGSDLADILTRAHSSLTGINGSSDAYHVSSSQYSSLLNSTQYANLTALATITTGTTLGATHGYVLCNAAGGAFNVTLPAASTRYRFHIKRINSGANAVTILPGGSDTIEGAVSVALAAQYNSRTLYSDGSGVWYVEAST